MADGVDVTIPIDAKAGIQPESKIRYCVFSFSAVLAGTKALTSPHTFPPELFTLGV